MRTERDDQQLGELLDDVHRIADGVEAMRELAVVLTAPRPTPDPCAALELREYAAYHALLLAIKSRKFEDGGVTISLESAEALRALIVRMVRVW